MSHAIKIKTEEICEKMDGVLARAMSMSGKSMFTSMKDDAEVILFRDCMALLEDLDDLLIKYAVALDQIGVLSDKVDTLTDIIKEQNEMNDKKIDALTEMVRKQNEKK